MARANKGIGRGDEAGRAVGEAMGDAHFLHALAQRLRAQGLTVETGLMCEEGEALCEGFLHRLETGRPMVRVSPDGSGFDGRFVAAPKADLVTELKRLGEAGYTRLWTGPGELADELDRQGLLST